MKPITFFGSQVAVFLSALLFTSSFVSSVSAEYIQFTFSGEVTEIGGTHWAPWEAVFFGDPVTIQFIVDSNAEDQIDGSDIGRYSFLELSVNVDGNVLATSQGFIQIGNEGYPDLFYLSFSFGNSFLGDALLFGSYNMFQSDALPTNVDWTQYGTSDFSGGLSSLPFGTGSFQYVLTQFDAIVIPAPPTMFVFLIGVSILRRRQ